MDEMCLKVNKVRIEFETKEQAITHRIEFGGTAVEADLDGDISYFWYSMPYFNDDIIVDLSDMEVTFLPLTACEVQS